VYRCGSACLPAGVAASCVPLLALTPHGTHRHYTSIIIIIRRFVRRHNMSVKSLQGRRIYMLTWYKFHYGLNLMRPPAARRCLHTNGFRQSPKPPPPSPTLPPVYPSRYPSRLRLAIFLYKVSTFLSRPSSLRWTAFCCVLSILRFERTCCALRDSKLLYPTVEK